MSPTRQDSAALGSAIGVLILKFDRDSGTSLGRLRLLTSGERVILPLAGAGRDPGTQ